MAPEGHRQRPLRLQVVARLVGRRRGFGPHPRDYSKKTNKTVKQLALRKAISSRINAGEVFLIEPISLEKPKTKDLVAKLKDGLEKKTTRAARH